MNYKISQLSLAPNEKLKVFSDIYVAQPDLAKEALAGRVFLIFEIESNKSDSLKIVNFLIENVNQNYYQNEKILLRERITSLKVEHIFESSLAKVNKDFAEFIEQEKIKLNPALVNITIGLIFGNAIYFTNAGKNKAFLIYLNKKEVELRNNKTKKTEIITQEDEYKIFDITKKTESDGAPRSFEKFFSNVINGKVPPKSYILFTNEALPEYFSNKQLIQIITTLPPASAMEQIKSIVSNINSYVSFQALLIKNVVLEKAEEIRKPALSTLDSVDNLNKTEAQTENILTPKGLGGISRWMQPPPKASKEEKSRKAVIGPTEIKDKIFVKKKSLSNKLKPLKNSGLLFVNFLVNFFASILNPRRLVVAVKQIFKKSGSALNRLNKTAKIFLAIILVCAIALSVSLLTKNEKNQQIEKKQNYALLNQEIETLINKIKQANIYNKDQEKVHLAELESKLASYPQETPELIQSYNSYKQQYDKYLEEIRNIKRVDAKKLVDFGATNAGASAQNIIYIPALNKIYCGDSAQKSVLIYDLAKKKDELLTNLNLKIENLALSTLAKDSSIYYLNNSASVVALNSTNEKMSSLPIALGTDYNNIKSINSYNNRLYALSPKDNSIFKYDKTADKFGAAQKWLKDPVDLGSAVDMGIDGNIYVLFNDGEIIKYYSGKKADFEISGIEPPITGAAKIAVPSDSAYIYVLEPAQSRIIVYKKNAEATKADFVVQYSSPNFKNAQDFTVDEKGKKIFILTGNSVYEFMLENLN